MRPFALTILLAAFLPSLAPAQTASQDPVLLDRNKAVVRRLVEEGWNKGKREAFDSLVAPDFTTAGMMLGPKGFHEMVQSLRATFAGFRTNIRLMVAEGDRVIVWTRTGGKHVGNYHAVPPTNRKIEWDAIMLYRVIDGKVVERAGLVDDLTIYKQLGVLPEVVQ